MFERFTELARESVVLAQEEAHLFNHDYIGTEHILFGLPEAGLVRAGEYVLEEFPMVPEITVSLTVPRAQDPGRSPGTRLSRTSRR